MNESILGHKIIKTKVFYGTYTDEVTIFPNSVCTECNTLKTKVISIPAEVNAGEQYSVEICKECLLEYLTYL